MFSSLYIYICAASGFAGIRRFYYYYYYFVGSPAPEADLSIFCSFRRLGHVKYSVLGLPALEKNSAFEAVTQWKFKGLRPPAAGPPRPVG